MKAIIQTGYCPSEHGYAAVVRKEDSFPIPQPEDDEATIRIQAAALNPADVRLIDGSVQRFLTLPMPFVMGRDFAGVVESLPRDSTKNPQNLQVGDMVCGYCDPNASHCVGSMAEYIVAPASTLRKVPTTVHPRSAAGLGVAGATAYQAVKGLQLQRGSSLLILGGSSAIGLFATAMAKDAGCETITVTSSNEALCRAFGATEVVNYRAVDWIDSLQGRSYDYVLDTVEGYRGWKGAQGVLKKSGAKYATVVMDDPKAKDLTIRDLVAQIGGIINRKFWSLFGWPAYHLTMMVANTGEAQAYFLQSIEKGVLPADQLLDTRGPFPFTSEACVEMLTIQQAGAAKGKLVMCVS
jgi:alcohol dehydrogenase